MSINEKNNSQLIRLPNKELKLLSGITDKFKEEINVLELLTNEILRIDIVKDFRK